MRPIVPASEGISHHGWAEPAEYALAVTSCFKAIALDHSAWRIVWAKQGAYWAEYEQEGRLPATIATRGRVSPACYRLLNPDT